MYAIKFRLNGTDRITRGFVSRQEAAIAAAHIRMVGGKRVRVVTN